MNPGSLISWQTPFSLEPSKEANLEKPKILYRGFIVFHAWKYYHYNNKCLEINSDSVLTCRMDLILSFRITSMAQMFVVRVVNMKHLLWIAHCSSKE